MGGKRRRKEEGKRRERGAAFIQRCGVRDPDGRKRPPITPRKREQRDEKKEEGKKGGKGEKV